MPTASSSSAAGPAPTTSSSSTFKFLITTDNHLGFQERDPRRGDDSFTTFEECLRAARVEHDVDAILLGGDLFHDNKPSLGCLARTTGLLRTYVLGDKPIGFTLLSDPKRNFPTHAVPLANFQDPNTNVAIPIFMIHGNHDDPVGGTSSIDILSTNGLVNYFGQVSSLDDIVVEPILLKKGHTYVALYGLGNVRDERLHRCFRMKKIRFVHPKPIPGQRWFKILLLHQNRGVRGGPADKCGIFETMLAGFGLDLIIWGNEHEQQMIPTPSEGFDVIQPGSTILTSLTGQECRPKQYGILEVRDGSYRLTPFTLQSVRPVVRRTIELWRENPTGRTLDAVEDFLRSVVEEMIDEAEEQVSRIPDDVLKFHPNIKYPIMRLSVDFTDPESTNFPQPNINRFGQQYMDVIVNPGDLLRPIKPKPVPRTMLTSRGADNVVPVVPVPQLNTSDIRTKVAEVFNANARDACLLLSEPEVSAAVYAFAEKGERDAIDERISELLNMCQKSVWKTMGRGNAETILKPDSICDEVVRYKQEINKRYAEMARSSEVPFQQEDEEQFRNNNNNNNTDDTSIAQTRPNFMISDTFDENSIPFGETASSASHVLNAAVAAATAAVNPKSHFAENNNNNISNNNNINRNNKNNEDDEDDELPDTGLSRVTMDALIANAVQQESGGTTARTPQLMKSTTRENMCSIPSNKRQREEVNVDGIDDENSNRNVYNHININNEDDEDGVIEILPTTSTTRNNHTKGGARKSSKTTTSTTTSTKAPRGKKGKQVISASSSMSTPKLNLTHHIVPGEIPTTTTTPQSLATRGKTQQTGALNMLSKWGSQS